MFFKALPPSNRAKHTPKEGKFSVPSGVGLPNQVSETTAEVSTATSPALFLFSPHL